LYGRKLLQQYIRLNIENWRDAVIVSPDAGGAKRATAVADCLGMPFALIHKGLLYTMSAHVHRSNTLQNAEQPTLPSAKKPP